MEVNNAGYVAIDSATKTPISHKNRHTKLMRRSSTLESLGYKYYGFADGSYWDGSRLAIAEIFSPATYDSKDKLAIQTCCRNGKTHMYESGDIRHHVFRCARSACPTCGSYEKRHHARSRASNIDKVLNSEGYSKALNEAGASKALLHVVATLPKMVTDRLEAEMLTLVHSRSLLGSPYLIRQVALGLLPKQYIKSINRALKNAFNQLMIELYARHTGMKIGNETTKSWKTPWQYVDVHFTGMGDPTRFTPHLHSVQIGMVGSFRNSKKGKAPGCKILPGWPNFRKSDLRFARVRWKELILKELESASVYKIAGDEPEEFVIKMKPIANPSYEDIWGVCSYCHRSHWDDLLNSIEGFAVPCNAGKNANAILIIRCYQDLPVNGFCGRDIQRIRIYTTKEIQLDFKILVFLRLIYGVTKGLNRSQTYGGWRDSETLESLGVLSGEEDVEKRDNGQKYEEYPSQFRAIIDRSKRRGRKFGLRRQYRVKKAENWSEWRDCNDSSIIFLVAESKSRMVRERAPSETSQPPPDERLRVRDLIRPDEMDFDLQ